MNKSIQVIMTHIGSILADTNAISFTITGWSYLKTRLVLHFQDCDQVFEFEYTVDGELVKTAKFFSKDRNYTEHQNEFSDLYDKVKPEEK